MAERQMTSRHSSTLVVDQPFVTPNLLPVDSRIDKKQWKNENITYIEDNSIYPSTQIAVEASSPGFGYGRISSSSVAVF